MNRPLIKNYGISIIILYFFSFFLYSCQPILKIAETKKVLSNEIAIEWLIDSDVNDIYIPEIDSVMNIVLNRFNGENHTVSIHKKREQEEASIKIVFKESKFASSGNLITGYIVSGLGLLASPVVITSITSGQALLMFWYFPNDVLRFSVTLSPNLLEDSRSFTHEQFVKSGAMFSNKTRRVNKISNKLESMLYKMLLDISGESPPKTKVTNTR